MLRLAATLSAAAALAAAAPANLGHGPAIVSSRTSPYPMSQHVLPLNRVQTGSGAISKRSALYKLSSTAPAGTTHLISLFEGEEFATAITIDGESYDVIVDSGSSDTWLVQKNFSCVDVDTSAAEPESECNFGKTFSVNSKTFTKIPNENFNIGYGDGEFLTGYLGTQDITVAGITVKNQTMGVVNYAGWEGDGTTSGLMGLAFPGLTSAYGGTVPSEDGETGHTQIQYSPIFTNMVKQGLSDNLFSLAISRNLEGNSGYLAFGGLPPVTYTGSFVTTPILETKENGYNEGIDFYTIQIDGITLGSSTDVLSSSGGSDVYYIVDSGTTLNYVPTPVATQINAAFSPAATYNSTVGGYVVQCSATAPKVGTKISGQVLYLDPLDLMLPLGETVNGEEMCLTGIVDGGALSDDELYILGDVFLKSLVAVYDVGKSQMAFAARAPYTSDDTY
ncbi:hypothetical protein TD95_001230 [Thielaviopsis punctulata]|uniref:Peptidase A1 domain-containing protein n=1 Tax=Thielaviopsis punctulata TaxID=72032 RepID=A0A0F4ZCT5_9PEZI|nr:hypothetical protein TD95_001230 [Thielaviopsis punctulata]